MAADGLFALFQDWPSHVRRVRATTPIRLMKCLRNAARTTHGMRIIKLPGKSRNQADWRDVTPNPRHAISGDGSAYVCVRGKKTSHAGLRHAHLSRRFATATNIVFVAS